MTEGSKQVEERLQPKCPKCDAGNDKLEIWGHFFVQCKACNFGCEAGEVKDFAQFFPLTSQRTQIDTATEDRLREIAEREQKATKGPWKVHRCSYVDEYGDGNNPVACGIASEDFDMSATSYANIVSDCSYDECHHPMTLSDANFMAHARTDIPWLLAQLTAILEENQRLAGMYEEQMRLKDEYKDLLRAAEAKLARFTALEEHLPKGYAIGDDATAELAAKLAKMQEEVGKIAASIESWVQARKYAQDERGDWHHWPKQLRAALSE